MKITLEIETTQDALLALTHLAVIVSPTHNVVITGKDEIVEKPKKAVKETPKEAEVETTEEDGVEIPEKKSKKESKSSSSDALADLTVLAKETVERLDDKAAVKAVINEFASRLSEVDPDDYPELTEKLKAL